MNLRLQTNSGALIQFLATRGYVANALIELRFLVENDVHFVVSNLSENLTRFSPKCSRASYYTVYDTVSIGLWEKTNRTVM